MWQNSILEGQSYYLIFIWTHECFTESCQHFVKHGGVAMATAINNFYDLAFYMHVFSQTDAVWLSLSGDATDLPACCLGVLVSWSLLSALPLSAYLLSALLLSMFLLLSIVALREVACLFKWWASLHGILFLYLYRMPQPAPITSTIAGMTKYADCVALRWLVSLDFLHQASMARYEYTYSWRY